MLTPNPGMKQPGPRDLRRRGQGKISLGGHGPPRQRVCCLMNASLGRSDLSQDS